MRLLEAAWPEGRCRLLFRVWPGDPPTEGDSPALARFEDWVVECAALSAARVIFESADGLALTDEHPLLWPYREGVAELAFHGRAKDPAAVVAGMWARHLAVAGDWIPFGDYLNLFDQAAPVFSLLETGGGILASGPRPLMEAYAEVLHAHGLDPSFVGATRVGLRAGEAPDLAVLLFGESYVIGSGFTAQLL